ncbi:MAG: ComF family protein [Hyphomicrobiaceae bacterium]
MPPQTEFHPAERPGEPASRPRGGPIRLARLAGRGVARAAGSIADLLVPPVCVNCRTPLTDHHTLCAQCWQTVDFIRHPLCDRLGIPLPFDPGGIVVSAEALAHPPAFDRARAVARYGGTLRDMIHGLKYGDQHHALSLFGRWLALAAADLLPGTDLIVPVPLAYWRLWRRRFNQAALLADELSRATGIRHDPMLLRRTRATETQVGKSLDQRRRNVEGAFAVPRRARRRIEGRNVLLVDDVITTGSTVEAATRALRRAGAARVDVVALARVTGDVPANA